MASLEGRQESAPSAGSGRVRGNDRANRLCLPPKGRLSSTSHVDKVDWYYRPVVGYLMRRRLAWVADQLPPGAVGALLEIGYGSGVFQYELARRGTRCVGVDVHRHAGTVGRRLREDHLQTMLVVGDAAALPFRSGVFDAVVAVSTLEFVPRPDQSLEEGIRVLGHGGRLLLLVPRPMRWADAVLRLLTGVHPESEFKGGRTRAQVALAAMIPQPVRLTRPFWLPRALAPYEVARFERP